ncbi:MAG: hypothetical protein ACE5H1_10265, partial [Thermodesulfobacteriota bacterium]
NMQLTENGYFLDPLKKELEQVLEKVGLGTISDIRLVTEGYGKEISKYSMKFGLDIDDDRLKEIIVNMKGKRMVSRFGNCYGRKDLDDTEGENMVTLSPEEEKEYLTLGTIKEVVDKCFNENGIDSDLVGYALGAVRIGLIRICSFDNEQFQDEEVDSSRIYKKGGKR